MSDLIDKIYQKVIYYEKDTTEMEQKLETEIQLLLEPYRNQFDEQALENIRGLMYAVELKTEQKAFRLGASSIVKLLLELTEES